MTDDINAGSELEPAQETIAPDTQEQPKTETTTEPPKEVSLRESLAAGLKEARQNEGKAQPEKQQAQTAPKDKAAKTGEPAAAVVDKAVQQPAAPSALSAQARAKLAAADPILKNEILSLEKKFTDLRDKHDTREKEFHKKLTAHDDARNLGLNIKDASAPYEAIIRAEGGDAVKAFKDFLNHAYLLRTASPQTKGQLLLQIAQKYGADLRVNPNQQVNPDVQRLEKTVQQLQWEREQEKSNQQQQLQTNIQSQIEAFSAKPENVHFEAVKADMAALLSAGRAKDLQDAYDMAVWARPDIRSTLLAAQTAEAEAKRRQEANAKVTAARKAGSSVVGSPGITPSATSPDRSLRDELRANLHAARA